MKENSITFEDLNMGSFDLTYVIDELAEVVEENKGKLNEVENEKFNETLSPWVNIGAEILNDIPAYKPDPPP